MAGLALNFVALPCLWRALALIAAVTLTSAQGFGGAMESAQNPEDPTIADYFDGLRAWELKEEPTAAAIWLKAAEWGDVRAMQRVAELYEQGQVIPHDKALAFFLVFAGSTPPGSVGKGRGRPRSLPAV